MPIVFQKEIVSQGNKDDKNHALIQPYRKVSNKNSMNIAKLEILTSFQMRIFHIDCRHRSVGVREKVDNGMIDIFA